MKRFLMFILIISCAVAASAQDAVTDEATIIMKDHKFIPNEITVPAGKKIKLTVENQDPTAEEFESKSLHREKVIKGNSKATILIGPLKQGEYPFVGEFHEDTMKGVIKVK